MTGGVGRGGWPLDGDGASGRAEMGQDDSGVEIAVLALAGVAALVVAATWMGANAAALVFGSHHGLGVGLGAAARALPRLARRPGSPALAWPPPVRRRLPGPVGYWACTAPVLAMALVAVVAAAAL